MRNTIRILAAAFAAWAVATDANAAENLRIGVI